MWSPARCKMRGCLPNSGTLGLSAPTFFGGSWGFHGNDCWARPQRHGCRSERTLPQAKQQPPAIADSPSCAHSVCGVWHLARGLVECQCVANRTPLACNCDLRQCGTDAVAIPLKRLLQERGRRLSKASRQRASLMRASVTASGQRPAASQQRKISRGTQFTHFPARDGPGSHVRAYLSSTQACSPASEATSSD